MTRIVEAVAIGVAARGGEHAAARDIRHRMGGLDGVAGVRKQGSQGVDQAKTPVRGGQKENTAVGTDLSAIESPLCHE